MNNRGRIAIAQIMILLLGFIAVVYILGSINLVSGQGEEIVLDKTKSYWLSTVEGKKGEIFTWDTSKNQWIGSKGGSAISDEGLKKMIAGKEGSTKVYASPATMTPAGSSQLSKWLGIDPAVQGVSGGEGLGIYQTGHVFDAFFSGVQWYVMGYFGVKMLGPMLGLEDSEIDAWSKAAGWGLGVGKFTYVIMKGYFGKSAAISGWTAFAFGFGFAAYFYAKEYEEVVYRIVDFDCKPWQADTGGNNCEECNKQELPCSVYQCKSLGQACELLNDEETGEAYCAWVNPNDVTPPVIEPKEDELLNDYIYTPSGAVNPPDRGVEIVNTITADGCAPAFTPLRFGISLNEPARCKVDYFRERNFEDMRFDLGDSSLFKYNHSQAMSLPGPNTTRQEGLVIRNDGEETLYVKCEDANGNSNTANFVFKFCVEKGPDTTAPLIVDTNVRNGVPVSFGQDTLDLEVYLNEPVDCRWSQNDESYDNMANEMDCSNAQELSDFIVHNNQNVYACNTTLVGIKNQQENKYYFRCRDQPILKGTATEGERNTNSESYLYTVLGTRELYIDEAGPNETVRDSTESVKVTLTAETSAGYNEGEAICYYGDTEEDANIAFFNTNSYVHSTDLFLLEGEYEYVIRCVDLGGNSDSVTINFDVESDSEEPIVVRAYKETGYLKIVTDEAAECVYDVQDCGYLYEDGLPMSVGEENSHFTEWNTKTKYYIKCQDEYGNKPSPNKCSAIIKPVD